MLRKIILFNLSVFFVSLTLSLIVGEYIVKHIFPQETYSLAKMVGLNIFEKSPIINYTLRKNVNRYLHIAFTREFTHFVSTNSFGTRGKEFSLDKPEDTYRILFLGDSITFGWGVEDNQTFAYLTEKILNKTLRPQGKYKKVEAINAGFTSGNSLDTYYVYYNEIGKKFNPDLVIVSFHPFNDISDMYYHNWEKIDSNGYPLVISSKTHFVDNGYLISIEKNNWKFEIPILRNSHLGILFLNTLERSSPQFVSQVKKWVGVSEKKQAFSFDDDIRCVMSLARKDCPDVLWPYIGKTEFILEGLKREVLNNRQEFLVILLPAPFQFKKVGKEMSVVERTRSANTINPQKYYRDFFLKQKIPYLELVPAYLIKTDPKELFYTLDGHIKQEGHRIVAKEIINYLQKAKQNMFRSPIPQVINFEEE